MTIQTKLTAEAPRVRVPLNALGLARENLRAAEPEDAEVPRLAETIRAAGLLYPPIVRAARRGEAEAYQVLDGRRRRFALLRLVEEGVIPPDHPVDCILAEDRAAQAAGAVLPNAEHAPIHPADVIVAIGKLRRARLSTPAIADALGYDETEVRRLDAMARVHPDVLDAFRAGQLTLRQVRLFARLKDRARQAELVEEARSGYFHEYALTSLVTGDRIGVDDPRFALVSTAAYSAAGGRIAEDLFGEFPGEVLDPEILDRVWRESAVRVAAALTEQGVAIGVARERGFAAPEGLTHLPFVHWGSQPSDVQAALDAARAAVETAVETVAAAADVEAREAALGDELQARLTLARLVAGTGEILAALLTPVRGGLDATFYQRPTPVPDREDPASGSTNDEDGGEDDDEATAWRPDVVAPEAEADVEVEGVTHLQHAAHTEIVTQGLACDLAERPETALIALTAQLFKAMVLRGSGGGEAAALPLRITSGLRAVREGAPAAPLVQRLEARREAYLASGLRPIPWVAGLADADRLNLFAELVAAGLDLREERTTAVRRAARAEAVELAALCEADLAARWTPDAAFLVVHSKPQLLAFLGDMQASPPKAAALKKDELVQAVVEAAAAWRWIPAVLRWPHQAVADIEAAAEPQDHAVDAAPAAQAA